LTADIGILGLAMKFDILQLLLKLDNLLLSAFELMLKQGVLPLKKLDRLLLST
jgi:hypothetical protein